MSNIYAQISAQNVVIAVSELAAPISRPDMIKLQSANAAGLGDIYDPNTGTFTPKGQQYRKVLSALEWVETWTPDEWRQLKDASQGTSNVAKRLDQLLDAIKLTGSFNVGSSVADTFYGFLESNGYITSQRRAELTQGILE